MFSNPGHAKRSAAALAMSAVVAATGGGEAHAEDWVVAAISLENTFETDLGSIRRSGDVAVSWMRVTSKSRRNPNLTVTERHDDCESRRYALGAFVRKDARGGVLEQGKLNEGWQVIPPGSVAEMIGHIVCAAIKPPAEEALIKDIGEGDWKSLGQSSDRKFQLYNAVDRAVKIEEGYVLTYSRSDYAEPEWIRDLPIRHIVAVQVADCVNRKTAGIGADFYMSRDLRVISSRVDSDKWKFESIAPSSFAFNNLTSICETARALPTKGEGGEKAEVATGTAWATSKGYLVTASHVVADGKSIWVYSNGAKVGEAEVVADDPANDLAVLKVMNWSGAKLLALPLALRAANLGKGVFTLGYPQPGVMGQKIKMTAGEVSSTSGMRDDARFLQVAIPVQGGNSGGPVIGWDGAVVGVVEAKLGAFGDDEAEAKPEMVNYAMKISYLRPLLEDLPDQANYTVMKPVAGEDLVAEARKAVFMVLVRQ